MSIPHFLIFEGGVNETWKNTRVMPEFPEHRWGIMSWTANPYQPDQAFLLLGKLLKFFAQAFPGWRTKQDPYPPIYNDIQVWYDDDGNGIAIFRHTYLCSRAPLQPSHYIALAQGTPIAMGTFFNCRFDLRPEAMNPKRWMWDVLKNLLQATEDYAEKEGHGDIDFGGSFECPPLSTRCAPPPNNTGFWQVTS